jgi:nucleotide-binding universal stress UspA family protein
MFKSVMAAIADDEISRAALQEAVLIASRDGARLCIVHAAEKGNEDEIDKRRAGSNLLERAKSSATPTSEVETRLLDAEGGFGLNSTAEAVANAAAEWGADLLVVGTKGRRGLERLVIGSVAEKLVQTVEISILLVRPH